MPPPYGITTPTNAKPKEILNKSHFLQCQDKKMLRVFLQNVWDGDAYLEAVADLLHRHDHGRIKELLKIVQQSTIDVVLRGSFYVTLTRKVQIDVRRLKSSVCATTMYTSSPSFTLRARNPTQLHVLNGDCLDAVRWLEREHGAKNTCCLVCASTSNPGGGYRRASRAQEEDLCRRTTLFCSLDDPYSYDTHRSWSYPLPEQGGVYAPDVLVFRESEQRGFAFIDEPFTVNFVAVSSYSTPPLVTDDDGRSNLDPKFENKTKNKLRAILSIAAHHAHRNVVLTAFGCGAYSNPPHSIAELFRELLHGEFKQTFDNVVFSILDDHNTRQAHNPDGNLLPFARTFNVDEPIDIR